MTRHVLTIAGGTCSGVAPKGGLGHGTTSPTAVVSVAVARGSFLRRRTTTGALAPSCVCALISTLRAASVR